MICSDCGIACILIDSSFELKLNGNQHELDINMFTFLSFFCPISNTSTGGPTSLTASLLRARTALSWYGTRTASGTTCRATTTWPSLAKREQVGVRLAPQKNYSVQVSTKLTHFSTSLCLQWPATNLRSWRTRAPLDRCARDTKSTLSWGTSVREDSSSGTFPRSVAVATDAGTSPRSTA